MGPSIRILGTRQRLERRALAGSTLADMPKGAAPRQRVRLFHWKPEEAKPLIAEMQAAGYKVEYDADRATNWRASRESPPHALVIDLTRMPSHGRYVAN